MDSINQQQSEKNRENLQGLEAAHKLKELGEKAKTCFSAPILLPVSNLRYVPWPFDYR